MSFISKRENASGQRFLYKEYNIRYILFPAVGISTISLLWNEDVLIVSQATVETQCGLVQIEKGLQKVQENINVSLLLLSYILILNQIYRFIK